MGQATDSTQCRYMIRRDLDSVLDIENQSHNPWSENDFLVTLKSRTVTGWLAERDDSIVGFMVYESTKLGYHILNIGVDTLFRRDGVGSQLLKRVFGKLTENRQSITADVWECNLDCQMFLKSNDFTCREILKEHYDNGEAAYRFRYNLFGLDE
jgi:ribosomal-protein-alanine N-acetyltransferase